MDIVRDDQGKAEIPGDGLKTDVDGSLFVDPLILHFQEEMIRAQDVAVRGGRRDRLLLLLGPNPGCHLSFQTTAEANQAGGVLRQQLLVDSWLVVEPFGVARRDQLDEVVIAREVFREQHQVIRRLAGSATLRPPVARCDVHLAAEDRVQPALPCLIMKDHRREHVPVLGDGHGRHPQLRRTIQQLLDPARAVEQRILGVEVKVDEVGHRRLRMRNADC